MKKDNTDRPETIKVIFKEWDCIAVGNYYGNNRKAISLIDSVDKSPIATASVNITDLDCPDDEVWIKDYSENTGMLDCLVKAGMVDPEPTSEAKGGFVTVHRFKLTSEALKLWQ